MSPCDQKLQLLSSSVFPEKQLAETCYFFPSPARGSKSVAELSRGMSLQSGHNVTHIHLHKAPYGALRENKDDIYLYALFCFKLRFNGIDKHKPKHVCGTCVS